MFSACQNESDNLNVLENGKTLKVADFAVWGELHNSILENVQENFIYSGMEANSDKSDKIKKVLDFNLVFIDKTFVDESERKNMRKEMIRYSNFVQADLFLDKILRDGTRADNSDMSIADAANVFNDSIIDLDELPSLNVLNEAAFKSGLYSGSSYTLLKRLIDALNKNYKGLLSDTEYENVLSGIVKDFDALNFDETSAEGVNVAMVLSISEASYQWWKENPDAMPANGKIPTVVAADAAGAIVGLLSNALYQGLTTKTHKMNWESLGWSALSGAATGSLGCTGKLTGFIKDIF